MLALAAASLAMGILGGRQSYVEPLYDMATYTGSYNGMWTPVTVNFMVNAQLPVINEFGLFRVFVNTGDTTHWSPNGSWNEITGQLTNYWQRTGNNVSFTYYPAQQNPRGTIWVQYGPASSVNGTEVSICAVQYGTNPTPGHNARPGAYVPISDITPDTKLDTKQQQNVAANFNINTPYPGNWGNNNFSLPQFWQSNGANQVEAPGNGWTFVQHSLGPQNGQYVVQASTNPSNATYYCIGIVENTVLYENYAMNQTWTEFSAVFRAY